jgi:glycosyltransferase involved in cell wall biosynthesis
VDDAPTPSVVLNIDATNVAVVLVARNRAKLVLRALGSLADCADGVPFHTVLVDDSSTDSTLADVANVEGNFTFVREGQPRGFAPGCDRGVANCGEPIVVVLREDLMATSGWLARVQTPFANPAVGAVRPRVLQLDGHDVAGQVWPCMAFRREAFDDAAGMIASAKPGRAVKVTLLEAIEQRGWQIVDAPDCVLLRVPESSSLGAATQDGLVADYSPGSAQSASPSESTRDEPTFHGRRSTMAR